jgi:hypothetical protein
MQYRERKLLFGWSSNSLSAPESLNKAVMSNSFPTELIVNVLIGQYKNVNS